MRLRLNLLQYTPSSLTVCVFMTVDICILQQFVETVPETARLLKQSGTAGDLDMMKQMAASMNPDVVKHLADEAGISKVHKYLSGTWSISSGQFSPEEHKVCNDNKPYKGSRGKVQFSLRVYFF